MLERVWRKSNILALLVGMQIHEVTIEKIWRFLKKLGLKPPYDSAIPLLGTYPEETKIEKEALPSVLCSSIYNS